MADTCRCAGQLTSQPDCVGRGGCISDSADGAFYIGYNLIHAGHHNNVRRPLDQTGDAVAVAVDIDELAVQCDRVSAHEEVVGENGSRVNLPGFLGCLCGASV